MINVLVSEQYFKKLTKRFNVILKNEKQTNYVMKDGVLCLSQSNLKSNSQIVIMFRTLVHMLMLRGICNEQKME